MRTNYRRSRRPAARRTDGRTVPLSTAHRAGRSPLDGDARQRREQAFPAPAPAPRGGREIPVDVAGKKVENVKSRAPSPQPRSRGKLGFEVERRPNPCPHAGAGIHSCRSRSYREPRIRATMGECRARSRRMVRAPARLAERSRARAGGALRHKAAEPRAAYPGRRHALPDILERERSSLPWMRRGAPVRRGAKGVDVQPHAPNTSCGEGHQDLRSPPRRHAPEHVSACACRPDRAARDRCWLPVISTQPGNPPPRAPPGDLLGCAVEMRQSDRTTPGGSHSILVPSACSPASVRPGA